MKLKKLFWAVSLILNLCSCSDLEELPFDSSSPSDVVNTRVTTNERFDLLGHGYNVTSAYLNPKSGRESVLDIDKLKKKDLILEYKLEESQIFYTSGKDIYEFTSNMSSPLTVEPEFTTVIAGESLNIAFGGGHTYSSDYSFAYFTQKYVGSRYRIAESDINVLRECLTQQFRDQISTSTPSQIVEKYGTHVLKDIYVGAKFEVYYMSKTTTPAKKEDVAAGIGTSLTRIFNIDGKFQFVNSSAANNKEQSLYYSTVSSDTTNCLIGSIDPETIRA